ncbi:hypothetical protein ACT8ZV_07815 [Nocardioides sp. MAHUQ-72]|uniref:hypothetical protein n=1 Tax=unclassified Nocardioides TaxID=2615069 RepID=UPI003618918F
MPQARTRRLLAAGALTATGLTPLTVTASPAEATPARMCVHDHAFVKSTERGAAVWMPTSNHFSSPSNPSGWQQGGQQGYSESDGDQTSRTKGSADTAEAGGGLNFGIGNVSTKYNHQWNRSTTTGNTQTKTWSQLVSLPSGKTSRMRIYQAGWRFKFTYVIVNDGGPTCKNQTYTRTAILPTEKKVTAMLVELYKNRGKARPRG